MGERKPMIQVFKKRCLIEDLKEGIGGDEDLKW